MDFRHEERIENEANLSLSTIIQTPVNKMPMNKWRGGKKEDIPLRTHLNRQWLDSG
jgi:hypothetical protein